MRILIVDDSPDERVLIKSILKNAGYSQLLTAESSLDAFRQLGMENKASNHSDIDLILMDIVMPYMDGVEACRLIKAVDYLKDIPIIVVTVKDEIKYLQMAFAMGAVDYITKPLNKVELAARVRSALRLKYEIDRRKAREKELLVIKEQLENTIFVLKRLSSEDELTGIPNRRGFESYLEQEWKRAIRYDVPVSLILVDIDFFKEYNDTYGHQSGDRCLKEVANVLNGTLHRPTDFVARYGGEEFAIILPNTDISGGEFTAEKLREGVEALSIVHTSSRASDHVTISLGVATAVSSQGFSPAMLVAAADQALYGAKQGGRNRVRRTNLIAEENMP